MLWLLTTLATITSFLSIYLVLRVIKKFDEFQIITSDAIELLNSERIKLLKQVENLHRRSRILNNETKENIRRNQQ
jgi:hypothetical protein